MITVTIREIVDGLEAVQQLSRKNMPAVSAYKVARVLRGMMDEYNLYQKTRTTVINAYAEKNDDGTIKTVENNNVVIQKDKIEVCNEELQKLLDSEVEINATLLKLDELNMLEFTPTQMYLLQPFICAEE